MFLKKVQLLSLLTAVCCLPAGAWAFCSLTYVLPDETVLDTHADTVYSLQGQGGFSCADLGMAPVGDSASTQISSDGLFVNWTLTVSPGAEVDAVAVQDASGKRCVYNYGPGTVRGEGLQPPADKPIASVFVCADGYVKEGPNMPPSVMITVDPDQTSHPGGSVVTFYGVPVDDDDTIDDISEASAITWASDKDGLLGTTTGEGLAVSDLSSGSHWITAQVTDDGGLTGAGTVLITIEPTQIQACSSIAVDGTLNDTVVTCPENGEPRLVCSADLSNDADKFALGADACCVCNASAVQCDPDATWVPAEGENQQVDPETGLGPCPVVDMDKALQVPSTLMFNNDPYYCYTIGGRRTCFAY